MKRKIYAAAAAAALCLLLIPGAAAAPDTSADIPALAPAHPGLVGDAANGGTEAPRIITKTTVNEDGSITTTATNLDTGTVTEVTTYADGSILTVERLRDGQTTTTRQSADGSVRREVRRADGSLTVTEIRADGSRASLETNEAGSQSWSVTLSQEAVEGAGEGAVSLPIRAIELGRSLEKALPVTISVPRKGAVEVLLPLESVPAGTLLYLAGEDGQWESLPYTAASNGVRFAVEDGGCVKVVNAAQSFSDVKTGDWFRDAVDYCSARGLLQGVGGGRFGPNETMSRGMLVTALHRLSGEPAGEGGKDFADVDSGAYYAAAVGWASGAGIVEGVGAGRFEPDAPITREQLAVILWRYVGSPAPESETLDFADAAAAGDYALPALCWAREQGILSGKGENRMDPTGTALRCEAAKMLRGFLKRAE